MSREALLLASAIVGLGLLGLIVPVVALLRGRKTAEAGAPLLPGQLLIGPSRRKEPRLPLLLRARIAGVDEPCFTLDLSASGCCVAVAAPLPDRGVDVTLSLPGFVEPVAVPGVVRWTRDATAALEAGGVPCVGVQFTAGPALDAFRERAAFLFAEPGELPDARMLSILVVDPRRDAQDALQSAVDQTDPRGVEATQRLYAALGPHLDTGATPELEKLLEGALRDLRLRRRVSIRVVEPLGEQDPVEAAGRERYDACVLDPRAAHAPAVVAAVRAKSGSECFVVGWATPDEVPVDVAVRAHVDAVVPQAATLSAFVATLAAAARRRVRETRADRVAA